MGSKSWFWQRRRKWNTIGLLVLGLVMGLGGLFWPKPSDAADVKLLFVGNSYTFGNNLNEIVKQLMERGIPVYKDVYTQRYTPGGYRFEQHNKDASDPNSTSQLRQLLVTGQDPLYQWDFVIFQEQSQIPGFPQSSPYWQASLNGIKGLHQLAQKKGAKSVLLMTWGRRKGDSQNTQMYPNYKTMQSRLRAGYKQYAAQAGTAQAPVYIAPVGVAWERVYDDIASQQKDPTVDGTRFSNMYTGDGSHPSGPGSFLAACVIYATLTGRDPSTIAWAPGNLATADRTYYQNVAFSTVMKGVFGEFQYPWAVDWADYKWPQNTNPAGKVISGVGSMPLVRVNKDVGSVQELWLGVTHDGNKVGDGRMWITAGGKLVVQTDLHVGFDGVGHVEQRDGSVEAKKIVFGKGLKPSYKLTGGTLQVETFEGSGSFSMSGGKLALQKMDTAWIQQGGVLAPGPGISRTIFNKSYTLETQASMELEISDPNQDEGKGADFVQANGTMNIVGTVKVSLAQGAQMSPGSSIVVLRAKKIEFLETGKVEVPQGLKWRKKDDFGTQVVEVYAEGTSSTEPVVEATPEPTTGPEPSQDASTLPEPSGSEPTTGAEPTVTPDTNVTKESEPDTSGLTETPVDPGQGCCQVQTTPTSLWLVLLLAFGFVQWRKKCRV